MPLIITKAIVIKAKDYGEYDKLVTLFCPDSGKLTVKARGVLREKAKLKFAVIPFNYGEYVLASKGDYLSLSNCTQIRSFYALNRNYDVFKCACTALKVLDVISGEGNREVFEETLNFLTALCESDATDGLLLKYMTDMLELLGFLPDLSGCVCGKNQGKLYFDSCNGLTCECCKGESDTLIAPKQLRIISDSLHKGYAEAKIGNEAHESCVRLIKDFFNAKIDGANI
ncbi:MAG: DNA repair protein RecO [Clostridia bacterium]|nr:DNA repair protein RecO [Clostridia bacterium]